MKKTLILASVLAAASANALTFDVTTSLDTIVNSASANVNKAYGTAFGITTNSTTYSWFKFSAADFPTGVAGGKISSLSLQIYPSVIDTNTVVDYYFNSNSNWLEYTGSGAGTGVVQSNPSTTPYLTFNDSGLPGASNSRFNSNSHLIGSVSFLNGGSGLLNKPQIVSLSLQPALVSALDLGQSFTIYSVAESGRLTVSTREGAAAGNNPAVQLQGVVTPEPASFVVLGVGVVALVRRRRK